MKVTKIRQNKLSKQELEQALNQESSLLQQIAKLNKAEQERIRKIEEERKRKEAEERAAATRNSSPTKTTRTTTMTWTQTTKRNKRNRREMTREMTNNRFKWCKMIDKK